MGTWDPRRQKQHKVKLVGEIGGGAWMGTETSI